MRCTATEGLPACSVSQCLSSLRGLCGHGCNPPYTQERVPFQYLTSTAHWHRYILAVGPGVLIPRPETELFPQLVQQVSW